MINIIKYEQFPFAMCSPIKKTLYLIFNGHAILQQSWLPILARASIILILFDFICILKFSFRYKLFRLTFILINLIFGVWFIAIEEETVYMGNHAKPRHSSFRWGIIFFIVSEIFFKIFLSFFSQVSQIWCRTGFNVSPMWDLSDCYFWNSSFKYYFACKVWSNFNSFSSLYSFKQQDIFFFLIIRNSKFGCVFFDVTIMGVQTFHFYF